MVDDKLINQLKTYQKWCIETKLSNGVQLDKNDDLVIISYKNGELVNDYYANDLFKYLYRKMKDNDIKLKRITLHGLRHTHTTALINMRIPTKTIADRLGNTVKVIYDVYAHSFKELEQESIQAFNESLASGAETGAK